MMNVLVTATNRNAIFTLKKEMVGDVGRMNKLTCSAMKLMSPENARITKSGIGRTLFKSGAMNKVWMPQRNIMENAGMVLCAIIAMTTPTADLV